MANKNNYDRWYCTFPRRWAWPGEDQARHILQQWDMLRGYPDICEGVSRWKWCRRWFVFLCLSWVSGVRGWKTWRGWRIEYQLLYLLHRHRCWEQRSEFSSSFFIQRWILQLLWCLLRGRLLQRTCNLRWWCLFFYGRRLWYFFILGVGF